MKTPRAPSVPDARSPRRPMAATDDRSAFWLGALSAFALVTASATAGAQPADPSGTEARAVEGAPNEAASVDDATTNATGDAEEASTEDAADAAMDRPPLTYTHTELAPVAPERLWRDEEDEEDTSDMRYPGYVVAGLVTLGAGVGLGIGSVVAAFEGAEKDALGLGALATVAWGTGVPLTLLGATPDHAGDSATAYAGIALATSGALGFGLGGTLWATREAEGEEDPDYIAPIALMAAGGAALVGGVITWAIGAAGDGEPGGERDGEAQAELIVGPTQLGVRGRF